MFRTKLIIEDIWELNCMIKDKKSVFNSTSIDLKVFNSNSIDLEMFEL